MNEKKSENTQSQQLTPDFITDFGALLELKQKMAAKPTGKEFDHECEEMKSGDTLHVSCFSDLAADSDELIERIRSLKRKGIRVITDREGLDSSTFEGERFLRLYTYMLAFDRMSRKRKQMEGIQRAKEAGAYKGRKKLDLPENFEELYSLHKAKKLTLVKMASDLGISRSALYRMVREYESAHGGDAQ